MGIDIELYAEWKVDSGWGDVRKIRFDDRDSCLFEILQGNEAREGRIRFAPLPSVAGLPTDMSPRMSHVASLCDGFDSGHHHISLRQLKEYDWSKFVDYGPIGDAFASEIIPQLERFGSPDDVRIVYWFRR